MSELSDWILVIFTAVLSAATIALAYHTYQLVRVSKLASEKAEARKITPYLAFGNSQPLSDGGGNYVRYSVKKIGSGHARRPKARAFAQDGRELDIKPHSHTDVIESGNLYYWDIYGAKLGDEIEVDIVFSDIADGIHVVKNKFTVH